MTPDELATELGVTGRVVRSHLRRLYPRTEAEKGQRWRLDDDQVTAVRASIQGTSGPGSSAPPPTADDIRRAFAAARRAPSAAEMRRAVETAKFVPTAEDIRRAVTSYKPPTSEDMRAMVTAYKPPTSEDMRAMVTAYKPPTSEDIRSVVQAYKPPTSDDIKNVVTSFATPSVVEMVKNLKPFTVPTVKDMLEQFSWMNESTSIRLVDAFNEALPPAVTSAARNLQDADLDRALIESPYVSFPKSVTLGELPRSAKWQVFTFYLVWMYCLLLWASRHMPDHVNGLTVLTGLAAEKLRRELWPKQD